MIQTLKNTALAWAHHAKMLNNHVSDIRKSVRRATFFEGFEDIDYYHPSEHYQTKIQIMDVRPDQVVKLYNGDSTTILNCGSFSRPGGKYMHGDNNDEARLCRVSTLYEVLKEFTPYYRNNDKYRNDGLFYNTGIFTPSILFDGASCNVLTVAVPDFYEWRDARRNMDLPSYLVTERNKEAVKERIDFILGILRFMGQRNIIIGAYGCDMQSPLTVASHFKQLLETKYMGVFENVIFSISDSKNLEGFKYIFGKNGNFYGQEYSLYDISWTTPDGVVHTKVAAYNQDDAMSSSLQLVIKKGYKYEDVQVHDIVQFDNRMYLTPEQVARKL